MTKTQTEGYTNAEYAEGVHLMEFLRWMQMESTPVPDTDEERSKLVNRWLNSR